MSRCNPTAGILRGATLSNSNFNGANLRSADLSNASIDGARLQGAIITEPKLPNQRPPPLACRLADSGE
ncbi:MAG: pentapeptide repeat-containing protein [Alphaproteobacteria bacterium]